MKHIFLSIISLVFCDSFAQTSINAMNLAHQYDPRAEIDILFSPHVSNSIVQLDLQLNINQGKARMYDYSFEFYGLSDYNQKILNPIPKSAIDSTFITSKDQSYHFTFSFNSDRLGQILFIVIRSNFSGIDYYYDVRLNSENSLSFLKSDIHILTSYLTPGIYEISQSDLFCYFYMHEFPPALPPMVTKVELPDKSMEVDSLFFISGDSINFKEEGLYFFQRDTSGIMGKSLRVVNEYFPKPSTLNQLKEPLVYITTKDEQETLESITDKRDFDKFWLDLTRSEERAKTIIKNYYKRVEQANYMFTTYKEGWKTDMGMIYIIFGPPDEAVKANQSESWIYLSNPRLPKMKFTFIKTDNIFSSRHYTLIRDKKHDDIWFRAIDLWRKSRF